MCSGPIRASLVVHHHVTSRSSRTAYPPDGQERVPGATLSFGCDHIFRPEHLLRHFERIKRPVLQRWRRLARGAATAALAGCGHALQ